METKSEKAVFGKFRFITKREIIIALAVIFGIFLIICDKPIIEDDYFLFKPFLWHSAKMENYGIIVTSPGGSEDVVSADKLVITDISDESYLYESTKDYILARLEEEQKLKDFEWEDVGVFNIGGGAEAYFFLYKPGGEYSGNKIYDVAVKKGDKMFYLSYRTGWSRYDKNIDEALDMMRSFRIR